MNNIYDIILIGGGHNGLTAACLLAKKGKRVLLLEKRAILGGIAAGEEFYPAYRTHGLLHDTSNIRTALIRPLQLEKYGLKIDSNRPGVALLAKDRTGIYLAADAQKAAQTISSFSQHDADAYLAYQAFIDKIRPFVSSLMEKMPPDLMKLGAKQILALAQKGLGLKRLGKKTMLELLKVAPMSVADFLDEFFETDFLKAALAAPAIYATYTGPFSSYTTLNLLLWECAAQSHIVGGPQALVSALEQAAGELGVEIKTETTVTNIRLSDEGVVEGVSTADGETYKASVIASSCTPKETFLNFFHPSELDYSLDRGIGHFRSRGTTAKVNLALKQPLNFKCETDEKIEYARTGNTFLEMEKAFDPVKYRQFSEEPLLDICIPSISSPELAPEGHQVATILVHFAPHHFDEGWTEEQKEKLGDIVIKTLSQYVDNLAEALVARETLTPIDLESRYALTGGHVYHGEHAPDQLITRPIPSCARYSTPISGLYLCGSGSHPGGGITAAPGALAAQAILNKHKIHSRNI